MNKEQYLNKRQTLMTEAENLITEGKIKEAEATMKKIEELDTTFEDSAKAQANLNALRGNAVVTNIANKSTHVNPVAKLGDTGKGPVAKDDKELYNVAFAKTLMGTSLSNEESEVFNEVNAEFRKTSHTAEEYQILVPETIVAGIWKEIGDLHPILSDLRKTNIEGDVTFLKSNKKTSDADWVDEDEESKDEKLGFGKLELTGCELIKSVSVTWKMKKMSINDFIPYITTELAEAMAGSIAYGTVRGKGKPGEGDDWKAQSRGIITALEAEEGTPNVLTYSENLVYEDITRLMGSIKSGYSSGACIYANNYTVWNVLANIVDKTGKPLFVPDPTGEGAFRLFGKAVKEEDAMQDGEVLLANVAKGYKMNVNENITLYQDDHVKRRVTEYMSYAIIDGDVLTTKAFALLKK